MASQKQQLAARRNIRKAQAKWKGMTSRQHAIAQPEGRKRTKPGVKGEGKFYRIVVRPKEEFTTFRNQDVGKPGHIQRLAGKRSSGSWDTEAWLISKEDAHVENGKLVPDSADAKQVLGELGSEPEYVEGDIFKARPRPNVPEEEKPTSAQRSARVRNIRKAQAARRSKTK